MILKGLRKLLQMAECAATGHIAFDTGTNAMPKFFQSKDVGNRYHELNICERCGVVYTVAGELTAEELAQEKQQEERMKLMQERMEKAVEEAIKQTMEAKVAVDKTALN